MYMNLINKISFLITNAMEKGKIYMTSNQKRKCIEFLTTLLHGLEPILLSIKKATLMHETSNLIDNVNQI